jgi:hypothetical protein
MTDKTGQHARKQRLVLDVAKKVEIIEAVEKGEKQCIVAERFGVRQATVSQILARKQAIREQWNQGVSKRKALKPTIV